MTRSDKAFWVGAVLVAFSVCLYGLHTMTGHPLGLYDLVFHAMPFTMGGLLMTPKLFPGIFVQTMITVRNLFGKTPDRLP